MKINFTTTGNYNPYLNQVKRSADVQSTNSENPKVKMSKEEKDFFVGLFPENKQEIMNHHSYTRTGNLSGVGVGNLLDRRG